MMGWRDDFDDSLLDGKALAFLVKYELSDPAAGITQRVMSHGLESLSEKQLYVFKRDVVDPWLNCKCRCGDHSVEGHELVGLWCNEGYCGRCAQRMEKDERR